MSQKALQQLASDKLRTLALGGDLAGPLVVERAVEQAVQQYDSDVPRRSWTLVTAVTGSTITLPAGWVAGRSSLLAVEHPVGQAPMAKIEAQLTLAPDSDTTWRIQLVRDSLSAATVRVHFTVPHTLTASECSIPLEHLNAVACWAAAEVCRQLATAKANERDATISAVQLNQGSASGDLARRAKDWFGQYRLALGLPDPEADTRARAAGTVVSLGPRRRGGRFSTLVA